MKKNITFVCGGTGGHVYPAIAIDDLIKTYNTDFIVEKNRQSETILQDLGKSTKSVTCNSKNIYHWICLFFKARSHLKHTHLLVATGGFITIAVALAAKSRKVPIILLEQNVLPGKATRIIQHLAKHICISFPQSTTYLIQKKCQLTGNPVRQLQNTTKPPYLTQSNNQKWLIFGGSQGAKFINELLLSNTSYLINNHIDIIHLTGSSQFDHCLDKSPIHQPSDTIQTDNIQYNTYSNKHIRYTLVNYCADIPYLYQWCNLAISRAGATTLAEFFYYQVAAILIPFPHAADNHQELNAQSFCQHTNSHYIIQKDTTFLKLSEKAKNISFKKPLIPPFAQETTSKVVSLIEHTLNQ